MKDDRCIARKPEGKRKLEDLGVDSRLILRCKKLDLALLPVFFRAVECINDVFQLHKLYSV
jgi:hypothetical protein